MYCPKCGIGDQLANAYCKRCGQWLPDITRGNRLALGGETPRQNIFAGLFMSALSTVAALISAIALYATYLGRGDAQWSVYLAAAFCLCIAGWQASSFAIALKLRRRLKQGRDAHLPSMNLKAAEAAGALDAGDPSSFIGVTVTENTTELLEVGRKKPDAISQ